MRLLCMRLFEIKEKMLLTPAAHDISLMIYQWFTIALQNMEIP